MYIYSTGKAIKSGGLDALHFGGDFTVVLLRLVKTVMWQQQFQEKNGGRENKSFLTPNLR
jgi:hypothetical protein